MEFDSQEIKAGWEGASNVRVACTKKKKLKKKKVEHTNAKRVAPLFGVLAVTA